MWKSQERLFINFCLHLNNIMDFTLILVIATLFTGIFSIVKSEKSFLKSVKEFSVSIFPILFVVLTYTIIFY